MSHFKDYDEAYDSAQERASQGQRDIGIERIGGGFNVFYLPNPENRFGHELRCEVVTPNCPKLQPRGHQ